MHRLFPPLALGLAFLIFALEGSAIVRAYAAALPTDIFISICGDGNVQPNEACDAGSANNVGGYGSSIATRTCMPGCLSFGPYCGDGILQVRYGEECDDGNNVSGDLCSATCQAETAVPAGGEPTRGSIPAESGTPGAIPSALETKVVLRGKAYPLASVDILLDGQKLTTVQADANADFLYSSSAVTPGTATFSFLATDDKGVQSFSSSATFDILQSAVTTVTNIFIPPTIAASAAQVDPGALLTLSGQSVPDAAIIASISDLSSSTLMSATNGSGDWALQVDTDSLQNGPHTAKAAFELSTSSKSGFGRSVSFTIGSASGSCRASATDVNGDKKVNLVDFSIFLTDWGGTNARSDFNCDGSINLADFSILLFNWTG